MLRSDLCSATQCRWGIMPQAFLYVFHQSEYKPECKSGGLNQTTSCKAELDSLSCHPAEPFCVGALAGLKPCKSEQ